MRGFLLPIVGLALLAASTPLARGQASRDAAVVLEPGYAIGHVTCADTQRPARLAQVRFVSAPASAPAAARQKEPDVKMSEMRNEQDLGSGVNPVETDMDGNFTVRNLKPGRYIVRVDLGGYLTPLMGFPGNELRQPDAATRDRIARELQIVDIRPRAETHIDVTLQRGAVISGTVRYDDGSPAIGIGTQLLERNAKGEWKDTPLSGLRFGSTDAMGRYEIDAVPPGSYLVRANLSMSAYSSMVLPGLTGGGETHLQISTTVSSLPVYTDSVLRERDATPIKVEGAVTYGGNDISLPISKLHQVSGTVVASDGHALNGGTVVLRNPDDDSEVVSVKISREDRQFHLLYVPEGAYTLSVEGARDITEVEVPNPPGATPKMRTEDKTLRTYGTLEQPLIVQSDVEGLVATVPDAKNPNPVAAAQASD